MAQIRHAVLFFFHSQLLYMRVCIKATSCEGAACDLKVEQLLHIKPENGQVCEFGSLFELKICEGLL